MQPLTILSLIVPMSVIGCSATLTLINGTVTVAGMFQLKQTKDGQCGQVEVLSVKTAEAVKWVFKSLNDNDYIPGVSIGLEVMPTCGVVSEAVDRAVDLMIRVRNDKQRLNKAPLVGLIGPGFSTEAERSSYILSSQAPDDRLLQLSHAATASSLSNAHVYSNFFRVIQSDSIQINVILALMKQLWWNYIAIIYDDDVYGRGAKDSLVANAPKHTICVAKTVPIHVDAVSISELTEDIRGILFNSESPISGVVVFARGDHVNTIVKVASDLRSQFTDPLSFIFSEAIGLSDTFFKSDSGVIHEAAKGAFVVSPPEIKIQEFEDFWTDIMRNVSLLLQKAETNPFLRDVYKSYSNCNPVTNTCPDLNLEQQEIVEQTSLWTAYGVKAAYVMAKLLKDMHDTDCKGNTGLCSTMRSKLESNTGGLVHRMREQQFSINFSRDFPSPPIALTNLSLLFNTGNDLEMVVGFPDYEVFQYQRRSSDRGLFHFQKIGTFITPNLGLQYSNIQDYQLNKEVSFWPDITHAQCKQTKRCTSCIKEEAYKSVFYRHGDVILGGIFPVYNGGHADPLFCSSIRTTEGNELVMAMEYVVELLNNRTKPYDTIFPGKTVGLLIINSCDQPLLIQNKLTKLFGNDLILKSGEVIDISKILGFIAAYSSSLSLETARILTEFGYAQVAYATTAAELSNRNEYPYFSRVTTPDKQQAKALIRIVTHQLYASDYIQIVYSKGVYGESGIVAIKAEAAKAHVCIKQEVEIDDGYNLDAVLQKLRRNPFAKIVILFIRAHQVEPLVTTLNGNMDYGEFFFIASEAWGFRPGQFTDKLKFVGTLLLSLNLPENTNFTRYLRNRDVSFPFGNPWVLPYIAAKYNCHINSSFDKTNKDPCSSEIKLTTSRNYRQDIWTPFVLRATEAFLRGSYDAFKKICGTQSEKLCDDYKRNPHIVWNNTIKQEVNIDGSGNLKRVFDDNGDGIVGYTVYNLKRNQDVKSVLEYVQVGGYNIKEERLDLDTASITLPDGISMPSTCPNDRACASCKTGNAVQQTNGDTSTGSSTTSAALGSFVGIFLLITIALAVFIFLQCRKLKELENDRINDIYDQPLDIQHAVGGNVAYGMKPLRDQLPIPDKPDLPPSRHPHMDKRLQESQLGSRVDNSYLHLSNISHFSSLGAAPGDTSSHRYTTCNIIGDNLPKSEDVQKLNSIKLIEKKEGTDVSVYLTPPPPDPTQAPVTDGQPEDAIKTDQIDHKA